MLYFQERTGGRTVDRRLNIRFLINKIFLIVVIFDVIMTSCHRHHDHCCHDLNSNDNDNCSGGSPHEGKRRELNRERDLVPQKRSQCQRHHDCHHHQCGLMVIIVGAEEEEASV